MPHAAIGLKTHIGRAFAVVLVESGGEVEVVAKGPIVMRDTFETGAVYHVSQERGLSPPQARALIESTLQASVTNAKAAIASLAAGLPALHRAAVLAGSGKPLPPLEVILRSHPLIHAAEGEMYRDAVARACEALSLRVLRIPAKEMEARAVEALGMNAAAVRGKLAGLGKAAGRPWRSEQRECALAAWLALMAGE